MSFYPVLTAPGCDGWTTLCNFPPNNWEVKNSKRMYVHVSWVEDNLWHTEKIGILENNQVQTVYTSELCNIVPDTSLSFLSLGTHNISCVSNELPKLDMLKTTTPAWRATLGLSTKNSKVSYQGEIDPFPVNGSLLTLAPFIQYGDNIENYLLLLNLEKKAENRITSVEIYNAENKGHRGTFDAKNNNITIIPLDNLGFMEDELPLIICKGMSAIPLYMSKTSDGSFLSLEHTHPPACYVVHGKRFDAQKILKKLWFSKVA